MASTDSASPAADTEDSESEEPVSQLSSSSDNCVGDLETTSEVLDDEAEIAANTSYKEIDLNNSVDLTEVTEMSSADETTNMCKTPVFEQRERMSGTAEGVGDVIDFTRSDWYKHRQFQRYWDHYRQAMAWCKKHATVSRELRVSAQQNVPFQNLTHDSFRYQRSASSYSPYVLQPSPGYYPSQQAYQATGQSPGKQRSQKRHRRKRKSKKRSSERQSSLCSEATQTEDSEMFEMEITQEMKDFFAKSEEHRKQREKDKKEADMESETEYVDVEELHEASHSGPSVEAPKERPGARRTAEMKLLYGKGAAMIHGMETALQMMYDRNVDLKQPKMWPNMPLRLIF